MAAIPVKQDFVPTILACGVVQAFLLAAIIFLRTKGNKHAIKWMGWFMICLFWIGIDLFLCYTRYMKYTIWWNDVLEFLVLLLGPFIYFFLKNLLEKRALTPEE